MAIFLSPGVFTREVDLSVLPSAIGPLRPAFIGTANKGPLNTPTLITSSAQYVDVFGEPFPESYLGYAVMAYFEEGNACFVTRVGIESNLGQPQALASISIDTSGNKNAGWGRIPVFTNIDFGRLTLREVGDGVGSNKQALDFHPSGFGDVFYSDVQSSDTFGPTSATLDFVGDYEGAIDDYFVMVITSQPGTTIAGTGYQIFRNSDGEIVAEGVMTEDTSTRSDAIAVGDSGFSVVVEVDSGYLDENDSFNWTVRPDNRKFKILVNNQDPALAAEYTMPTNTYTTTESFVQAANALLVSEGYVFISYTLADGVTVVPQIRSLTPGDSLQIWDGDGWALELGSQRYAWDIPRSFLIGLDPGPYNITTQNNRVSVRVIGPSETKLIEFSLPNGININIDSVAQIISSAGTVAGESYWRAYVLTVPGGTRHLIIETTSSHRFDKLKMLANFSNIKTLRFAEEFNIQFPHEKSYRGFNDNRQILPDSGETNAANPLSCELNPSGDACAIDSAYFSNIVGWFVAESPGTWANRHSVSLDLFTSGVGDAAGRYIINVHGPRGEIVDSISDVSFDKRNERYVGDVINPGSRFGGASGNRYVHWEERPAFLNNDVNLPNFEVRTPSQFRMKNFIGAANGIPIDPAYSSELDAAVIGNPALATGLYAFQNPESIDVNLLAIPGFSSGAVIGTALQVCESRGDVLFVVDPPFGLRPQQTIDWHNGMLTSDLRSAINSSYGALYWGWLRVFDQFGNTEIWVPPSGHIAAIFSRTARETEQWQAPAGVRRGRMLTAIDVEYSSTQGERDALYGSGNAVNPIVRFPQEGIVVWGQRTLQRANTALDRVNVRMLSIYIKKNLTQLLRNFIFEPNDRILWRQVQATVEPFLGDIQSRRGLNGYKVVVDETNNTPERVDRNELWVTVFIRPTRAVEFIALNVVVLRTGASFASEETLASSGISGSQTAT
jgi:phage tail sheath protein FI